MKYSHFRLHALLGAWWLRLGCCPDCSVERFSKRSTTTKQLPNTTKVFNVVFPEVPVLTAREKCYAEIVSLNCYKIILALLLVSK